jgi:hypothetical protein
MGFTQLIAVLKARRGALLAVWGGVVLLALLLSLLLLPFRQRQPAPRHALR